LFFLLYNIFFIYFIYFHPSKQVDRFLCVSFLCISALSNNAYLYFISSRFVSSCIFPTYTTHIYYVYYAMLSPSLNFLIFPQVSLTCAMFGEVSAAFQNRGKFWEIMTKNSRKLGAVYSISSNHIFSLRRKILCWGYLRE